jgi:hypothetical protein
LGRRGPRARDSCRARGATQRDPRGQGQVLCTSMRFRNCPETGRQLKALVSDAVSQAVISPPSLDHPVGALLEIARRVWMVIPKRLAARRSQTETNRVAASRQGIHPRPPGLFASAARQESIPRQIDRFVPSPDVSVKRRGHCAGTERYLSRFLITREIHELSWYERDRRH